MAIALLDFSKPHVLRSEAEYEAAIAEMNDSTSVQVTLDFFTPDDAPVLTLGDADPEHRRRFDFPESFQPSDEHSREVIAGWERDRQAGKRFVFAVRDVETGELLGGCELLPLGDGVANVSYWTYPRHRRRGVATRALRLICEVARRDLGIRLIELVTDADNLASQRIAAAGGFTRAGDRDGRLLYVKEVA